VAVSKKRRFALNTKITSYDLVIARCFLALIFVVEGISKIFDPDATRHYMQAKHLPGGLLWPVIIFEIGSGLLAAVGLPNTCGCRRTHGSAQATRRAARAVRARSYTFPIRGSQFDEPARAIELTPAGDGVDIPLAAFEKFMVVTALF
jgi:uncharacterized protein YjeT (DUF2065 family)